jgi:NAD(P)-dependent dehydrogenase (short-subunit alcohol dehydrogenase family)
LGTIEIEKLMATNFYSVVHVMRAVLPVMRKQRSGRIINISSLAGIVGFKHCGAYSAAKFAVEGLSASVASPSAHDSAAAWRLPRLNETTAAGSRAGSAAATKRRATKQ